MATTVHEINDAMAAASSVQEIDARTERCQCVVGLGHGKRCSEGRNVRDHRLSASAYIDTKLRWEPISQSREVIHRWQRPRFTDGQQRNERSRQRHYARAVAFPASAL